MIDSNADEDLNEEVKVKNVIKLKNTRNFFLLKPIFIFSLFLIQFNLSHSLICQCLHDCPQVNGKDVYNGTCKPGDFGFCYAGIEEFFNEEKNKYEPLKFYGCSPPDVTGLLMCKGNLSLHFNPKAIECCDDKDLCNQDLKPTYKERPRRIDGSSYSYIILVLSVIASILFFIILIFYKFHGRVIEQSKHLQKFFTHSSDLEAQKEDLMKYQESTGNEMTGSGKGLPKLMQTTISNQINLRNLIHKGSFSEIWLGEWRGGNDIAVKIYFTKEENCYKTESSIYKLLLSHENILTFIAADLRSTPSSPQMLIITEYHENGSICDYLMHNKIDIELMLNFMYSILNGLCHLHTEIRSTSCKPAIAHRNLKSRNILIKNDLTCCLSDFSLSMIVNSNQESCSHISSPRYMSPEILSNINLENPSFDYLNIDFIKSDIYSVSLILWEIATRCEYNCQYQEYNLPYSEYVPDNPSIEQMIDIVCEKNIRPKIPSYWNVNEISRKFDEKKTVESINNEIFRKLIIDLNESWNPLPIIRPSSLRLKKNLENLSKEFIMKLKF